MISRIKKELQNRKRDNKGAALVMVIVAIAFIGMLVAMILYMAYCNYLMKNNDKLAKDNFYSAEYALDVLNAGLQMDVSKAMSEAYVETMNNSSGKSDEDMEDDFQKKYKEKLVDILKGSDSSKWDIDYLKKYWDGTAITVAASPGLEGAYLSADGDNKLESLNDKDYLTLYNLKVVYTDDKGFVSIIKTDIRVKIPDLGFVQDTTQMSIEQYSLIANRSLINDELNSDEVPQAVKDTGVSITKGSQDLSISGSVFGGNDGIQTGNQTLTKFVFNEEDKKTGLDYSYNLIADSINVENATGSQGFVVEKNYKTYVENINVETARLNMSGTMYVGDDMDIAGVRSDVTLSGDYQGYGNALGSSDGSSSILINGGDTSLDFSRLEQLMLSGHAYVGAKKYDADEDRLKYGTVDPTSLTSDKIMDTEEYWERLEQEGSPYRTLSQNSTAQPTVSQNTVVPYNKDNVMMGESISVKANQLLYMVPADCIGYDKETKEQVIAKNPMTYEEYEFLTQTEEVIVDGQTVEEYKYHVVSLNKLWSKLGISALIGDDDYKAVFRRVNGKVLVYLYLDFGSDEMMANEFFKAYYEYDKDNVNNYVKSYISDMKWSSNLTGNNNAKLTLAGNAFYLSRHDEVIFQEHELADGNEYTKMLDRQMEYSNIHESMMHSLSPKYDELTSLQQSSEIFDSLVDEAKLEQMSKLGPYAIANGAINLYATIKDGDVVYPSGSCPTNSKMIVASGDIYLTQNFSGLAIAGGNIYICENCKKVDYNPAMVLQVMRAKAHDSAAAKDVFAYEVFGAKGALSYAGAGDGSEEDEEISLSDLILYQNWQKQ
nr:hypothetical protein [Lachnospiraceae bacterium]